MIPMPISRALVPALLILAALAACERKPAEPTVKATPTPDAAARLEQAFSHTNVGIGFLNQFLYQRAVAEFRAALEVEPGYMPAMVNLGIGLFNQNENEPAIEQMAEVLKREPDNRSARYIRGMAFYVKNQLEASRGEFEALNRVDPRDSDTLFWLGKIYEAMSEYDKAVDSYKKAVGIDSDKVNALYRIGQNLIRKARKQGDKAAEAEAKVFLDRYNEARKDKPAVQENYLTHGRYALATPNSKHNPVGETPARIAFVMMTNTGVDFVHGPVGDLSPERADRFLASAPGGAAKGAPASPPLSSDLVPLFGSGAVLFDYDNDGDKDLYLVNASRAGAAASDALYRNDGSGTFSNVTKEAGLGDPGQGMGAFAADYDNDGNVDLHVTRNGPNALYRNRGNGTFEDVAPKLGVNTKEWSAGAAFVDFDHDSDLDLLVLNYRTPSAAGKAGALSPRLYRNNGPDKPFSDVTKELGLDKPEAALGLTCTDIDNDRDIDFVLAGDRGDLTLLSNNRGKPFGRAAVGMASGNAAPLVGTVTIDLDGDRFMDVVVSSGAGLLSAANRQGVLQPLAPLAGPSAQCWGLAALDADNDGDVDIMAACGGKLVFLDNRGGKYIDSSTAVGFDSVDAAGARALAAGDIDGDGDLDLVVTRTGRAPLLLRNDGGNANGWIEVAAVGRQGRSNRNGYGLKAELLSGSIEIKREWVGGSGYLSQDPLPVHFGLGSKKQADFVHILWPSGIVQAEMAIADKTRARVEELDRQPTSCPMLYAWNDERFALVTDVMGATALGFVLGPDLYYTPDPDEYVPIDRDKITPRDGRVHLTIGEHLQETTYVDRVRLLVLDHPADLTVLPNERFYTDGRVPEYFMLALSDIRPIRAARDRNGNDATDLLTARDLRHPDIVKHALEGYAEPHSITVDLGDIPKGRDVVLIMNGTLMYPWSSGNLAAAQQGLAALPPKLEAQLKDGSWVTVAEDIGFPCGLFKTATADLTGLLPEGAHIVRISTNQEIYWDEIRVAFKADRLKPDARLRPDRDRFEASPSSDGTLRIGVLQPAEALLRWAGYPQESNPVSAIHVWDYKTRIAPVPWMRQGGNYTRYGEVEPLLEQVDDRFAILAHGDELAMTFDTRSLAAPPRGWVRDYCLMTYGYAKDMDINGGASETVEPLPYQGMKSYPPPEAESPFFSDPAHQAYVREWNTRYIAKDVDPRSW